VGGESINNPRVNCTHHPTTCHVDANWSNNL
jgi:hypothetical protein